MDSPDGMQGVGEGLSLGAWEGLDIGTNKINVDIKSTQM